MTHEQKIKALIEAGEKAVGAVSFYDGGREIWDARDGDPTWMTADMAPLDCDMRDEDVQLGHFFTQAANARKSIKLLAEIAEAAAEVSDGVDESLMLDDLLAEWNRRWKRLNALLAKWAKETG